MDPVKVFIVDDSTHLCEMLAELIEDPGNVIVCGTADTARGAVDDISRTEPDIVIADLQLREGSGFDVITAMRARNPGGAIRPPRSEPMIVLFSNHMGSELKKRALELGADHFLDKTSDHGRLLELIQQRAGQRSE